MIKKIGLLGLSADPPHCGHLEMAKLLLKKKVVDEIWLIPCYRHSFGKLLASANHRWKMSKLLEEPGIKASNMEIRRQGISYTIDTMRILKNKYHTHQLFWVVGSDIVKPGSYKKWKDWKKLFSSINFLVVNRVGFKLNKAPAGFILVKGRVSGVSSTDIRERIRKGLTIDNLVPPKIKEYVGKNNLYRPGLTF
ncbi:MAG: nicotinate (nicotinamide) nucleotide adenylyltransferase [Candidatus Nealsonbacteria bacterium]|nr:nicotinate (nicotinamide) nucleotide adenylyltransferase [Candidatus Nealsonbacteria bacterium]